MTRRTATCNLIRAIETFAHEPTSQLGHGYPAP